MPKLPSLAGRPGIIAGNHARKRERPAFWASSSTDSRESVNFVGSAISECSTSLMVGPVGRSISNLDSPCNRGFLGIVAGKHLSSLDQLGGEWLNRARCALAS